MSHAAQGLCFAPMCGDHGTFSPPCACTCAKGWVTDATQQPSASYLWCSMPANASVTIAYSASAQP